MSAATLGGAELSASADAVITLPAGPGALTVYLEGSTAPDGDGVAVAIGEVDDDIGSALDGDGDKGVFAAVEGFGRIGRATVRGGAWANTRDHTTLDGADTGKSNAGLYGVADLPSGPAS